MRGTNETHTNETHRFRSTHECRSTQFYSVLLGFTRFYSVLLSFTRFYSVLLGFTRSTLFSFNQVKVNKRDECKSVLLGFTQ